MPVVQFQGVAPSSQLKPGQTFRPELHGFDDTATPSYLALPLNNDPVLLSKDRFVQVTVLGAKQWTVVSETPATAAISNADDPPGKTRS